MTFQSRLLAGAAWSMTLGFPMWCAAQTAGSLPPAPMPDSIGSTPPPAVSPSFIPPAPQLQSPTTLTPQYQPPTPSTVLAPQTQAWANQAYPQPSGSYPAYATPGAGPGAGVGPFWAPGGYEPRIGSPYYYHDPNGGQFAQTGNPYYDHYGPGFQRHSLHGHYRFPYYNYRAPWYYPGRAVYNRDTNQPW